MKSILSVLALVEATPLMELLMARGDTRVSDACVH